MTTVLRPVRPGSDYAAKVEGGVRRRAAPSAGLIVELPEQDIFLPAETVAAALSELGWSVVAPGGSKR